MWIWMAIALAAPSRDDGTYQGTYAVGAVVQHSSPGWEHTGVHTVSRPELRVTWLSHSHRVGTWGVRFSTTPVGRHRSFYGAFVYGVQGRERVYGLARLGLGIGGARQTTGDNQALVTSLFAAPTLGVGVRGGASWGIEVAATVELHAPVEVQFAGAYPTSPISPSQAGLHVGVVWGKGRPRPRSDR